MKTREHILNILEKTKLPLTEQDLRNILAQSKGTVNKTTIYRALDYLKQKNLIEEIEFGDGKKRYESAGLPHHHHAICLACKKIEDVLVEDNLSKIEQKIYKTKNFIVNRHALEFFGLCHNCT